MTRSHIIVLPGGGYHRHAPHEGEPVAAWLREIGGEQLEASVFLYPVLTRHPGPLDAVRAEVKRVRDAGAERVGVIGFSAGGHAAGLAALAPGAAPDERLDLAILGYPVVSMGLEKHAQSRENLLGAGPSDELSDATSLELLVTASAPPFFVWHTAEDTVVSVRHSYLLGEALAAAGVQHSLHVFPRGKHGLGLAAGSGTAASWPRLCEEWLREQGWLT